MSAELQPLITVALPLIDFSKPITVEKLVPLDYDLNLLAAFDTNAFDDKRLQ